MKSFVSGIDYLKSLTVLYVEDDNDTREQLCYLLSKTVAKLITANDGAEGLQYFHDYQPDIVITDLHMPLMNGLDMAVEIRKTSKFTPLVVLTAHEELDYLRHSINAGINKFLIKPINGTDFMDALHECSEKLYTIRSMQQAASTDLLTGLPNRWEIARRFESEKSSAERYGTPLSLVIADVDYFKKVNDTYGHLAGDLVLKKIASALKSVLRTEDLCGRWGGEEFIIIIPKADLAGALTVAEKLRVTISQLQIEWQGDIIQVTASLGVGMFNHGMSLSECINPVDKALYTAKTNGRNRVETAVSEGEDDTMLSV